MRGRIVCAGLVAVGLALAVAGPAAAAPAQSDEFKMKIAKRPDGPFKRQQVVDLENGESKTFHVRVTSITGQKQRAILVGDPDPLGATVKFFNAKSDANISAEVGSSEGFRFATKPGQPKRFRFKATKLTDDVSCIFVSAYDPQWQDVPEEYEHSPVAFGLSGEGCFG